MKDHYKMKMNVTFTRWLICLAVLMGFWTTNAKAQVTTNSGSGLAASYPSLAAAITDLNLATISSPVVITLTASETAPAGTGYYITATGSVSNTIIINGAGFTVTAGANTVAGNMDAIFKIVGGDFITIQNFIMVENTVANTVTTAGATNTMTEAGVLLIHASATDGAQNNTIQGNTITLSAAYANSVGILSTSASTTTNASPGANTTLDATSTAGTNSSNKVYSNTISSVAYGMMFICPPITATVFETGNDIGGTSISTANTVTYGNNTASTGPWNRSSTASGGIVLRNGAGNSIRFNTVNTIGTLTLASTAISISSGSAPTGVTYTSTISNNIINMTNTGTTAITGIDFGHGISTGTIVGSNNNITLNQTASAAVSAAIIGIKANYSTATNTCNSNSITIVQSNSVGSTTSAVTGITCAGVGTTVNVQNNIPITIRQAVSGTGSFGSGAINFVDVTAASGTVNVTGNTFNSGSGTSIRSTGTLQCITVGGSQVAVLDNRKGNTAVIDRIAASGTFAFSFTSSSPSEPFDTISGNNITFTGIAGTSSSPGIINASGGASATGTNKSICNNTISVSGTSTGSIVGILNNFSFGKCSQNSITISTAATSLTGINMAGSTGVFTIGLNQFDLTSTSVGTATIIGLTCLNTSSGIYSVFNNTFTNLRSTGGGAAVPTITGINISGGTNGVLFSNVTNNTFTNLATSGASPTGATTITGISINASGFRNDVSLNTFTNLSAAATSGTTTINGISVTGGTTNNIFSSIITNISSASTGITTLNGLNITGGTTNNIFKNKIYGLSNVSSNAAAVVNGINSTGGTTNNIFNNLIGGLSASATSNLNGVNGINANSSNTYNVFFNTIYLNSASSAATFGSSCVNFLASATTLNLRNNNLLNLSTPGTEGSNLASNGIATVLRRSTGTAATVPANYNTASNKNNFWVNPTAGSNNHCTYVEGTTTITNAQNTLANMKAFMVNRDQASYDEQLGTTATNVSSLISTNGVNANFLNIAAATSTQLEGGADPITTPSITDDYNGVAGNRATSPDVGAWEFSGTSPAPVVTFNSITPGASCTAVAHLISVDATTPSGTITGVTITYNNGTLNSNVLMTNTVGNTWEFSIPIASPTNTTVTWSVTATNSISLTKTLVGAPYQDDRLLAYSVIIVANPNPICAGSPSVLSASVGIVGGTAIVGTGSSLTTATTQPTAFCNRWPSYRMQMVYTAAELSAVGLQAGNITAIAFNTTTLGDAATNSSFRVSIGNTALSVLTTFVDTTTGFTTVFPSQTYTHTASGIQTIPFSTPFNWDGTSNIIVQLVHNGANATNNAITFFTATAGNTVAFTATAANNSASLSPNRLNTIFTGTTGPAVSGVVWNDGISNFSITNPTTVTPAGPTTYTANVTALGCTKMSSGYNITIDNSAPSTQALNITTTGGGLQLPISWTNGNGNNRVVYINTSNSFVDPVDGTSPTANTVWANSGQQCVFNGTGNSVLVTGLSGATTYWFRVYESRCSSPTYLVSTSTNNPNSITTQASLQYVVTRTTANTYNSIASVGLGGDGTGTLLASATGDEGTQNVAFTGFNYQGSPVTSFTVHTNGLLFLNNGLFTYSAGNNWDNTLGNISLGGAPQIAKRNAIAPFYDDLNKTGASFGIFSKVVGNVATIEWFNTTFFGLSGPQLYYQVVLDGNDNSIQFNYGNMQLYNGTQNIRYSYTCGLSGAFVSSPAVPGQIMQQQYENTTFFTHENSSAASWGANGLSISPEPRSSIKFTPGTYVPVSAPSTSAPSNDEFATAITRPALTAFPSNIAWDNGTNTSNLFSTRYSTHSTFPDNGCGGSPTGKDVWFKFNANNPDATVRIYGSGGLIPRVSVYDQFGVAVPSSCAVGTQGLIANSVLSSLSPGDDYYVRVYHENTGTTATGTATVSGGVVTGLSIASGTNYSIPNTAFSSYAPQNQGPRITFTGGGGTGAAAAWTTPVSTTSSIVSTLAASNITFVGGAGYTSAPTVTIESPDWGITGEFGIIIFAKAANDECATATTLTNLNSTSCVTGQNQRLDVPTAAASQSIDAAPSCGIADDDVWYKFTATGGLTNVTISGTNTYDPAFEIWDGGTSPGNCGTKTTLICVNATGTAGTETTNIATVAGTTYFIRVYDALSGFGGTNSTFNICVTSPVPSCIALPSSPTIGASFCNNPAPSLNWSAANFATGYDVYFDAGLTATTLRSSNQAGLSYTPGALITGSGTYAWKVVPRNSNGPASGCSDWTFSVTDPQITGTTTGSRCGYGTVALGATGSVATTVRWFANPTGGAAIGTGTSFTTPAIASTTQFYAEAGTGLGSYTGLGREAVTVPEITGASAQRGIVFDATSAFTLVSAQYFSPTTSVTNTVTVVLQNNAGTQLQSVTLNIVQGASPDWYTMNLNFPVAIGTGYRLLASFTQSVNRTSLGVDYSQAAWNNLSPFGTITSGFDFSASSTTYSYFHNISITDGCTSARVAVTASVNSAPSISQTASQASVCNGGSSILAVSSSNDPNYSYVWSSVPAGYTASGAGPHTINPTITRDYIVVATDNTAGPFSGCASIDTVTVTALPASPTITSSQASICTSGSATLSLSPSTGYPTGSIQWEDSPTGASYTPIGGANLSSYLTPVLTGPYYYRATIKNSAGTTCAQPTYTQAVYNPSVSGTTPGTRCGAGAVSLAATAGGFATVLNWYDVASGGVSLATGTSFNPLVNSTTTYYVEASAGGGTLTNLGREAVSVPEITGASVQRGLVFDATQAFTLVSAQYFSPTLSVTNNVTVVLQDNTGAELQTVTLPIVQGASPGWYTMNLNFPITAGTGYRLLASFTQSVNRASVGVDYSNVAWNNLGPVGIITSGFDGFATSVQYNYFHNITISYGCISARTPVLATVTPSTPITASAASLTVCAGSSTTVSVSSANPNYNYTWTSTPAGFTATGIGPHAVTPVGTSTTYTVLAVDPADNCGASSSVTVSTSINNLAVIATANPAAVCLGSNSQLNTAVTTTGLNYSMAGLSGQTYSTLNGPGISIINTSAQLAAGMASGNQDDGGFLVGLPFTFTYNGNSFTSMTMCTNGWVAAGDFTTISAVNSRVAANLFTSTVPNNTIAAWFKDMGANFPTGTGSMRHGLIGTDVYAFQWDNAVGTGFSDGSTDLISFQINIYGPASTNPGRVQIVYGPTSGTIAFAASQGMENATGGTNNYINALDGSGTTTITSTVWPGDGNGFQFTPSLPGSYNYSWTPNTTYLSATNIANPIATGVISNQTYSVVVTDPSTGCIKSANVNLSTVNVTTSNTACVSATKLSWPDNAPNGYILYVGTAPGVWTVIPGQDVSGTTSITLPLLQPNTTYYYELNPVVASIEQTGCTTGSFLSGSSVNQVPNQSVNSYKETLDNGVVIPALPCGMTSSDENFPADGFSWYTSNIAPKSGTRHLRIDKNTNNTIPKDDWFYSAPMNLTAGRMYRIYFWHRVSTAGSESFETFLSSAPDAATMQASSAIYVGSSNSVTYILDSSANILPTVTGVYYYGFHANGAANGRSLYMDEIQVKEIPVAALDPASCTTLASMYDQILVQPIYQAQDYKFLIENLASSFSYEYTRNLAIPDFRLKWAPGVTYGLTYDVSVSYKKNNVWSPYGLPCPVTMGPFPTTQLRGASCGAILTDQYTPLYYDSISGANDYEIKIVQNTLAYDHTWTRGGSQLDYRMYWAYQSSPTLVDRVPFGFTYDVQVRALVGRTGPLNGNLPGTFGTFGPVCTVQLLGQPQTQLVAAPGPQQSCGKTLVNLNDPIYCIPVTGASNYRYRVVNLALGYDVTTQRNSAVNDFRLTWLPTAGGNGIRFGTTYDITVEDYVGGVWSTPGPVCQVTTPASPLTSLQPAYCPYTLPTFSTPVYSTTVIGATNYRYRITDQATNGTVYTKIVDRNSPGTDFRFSWTLVCCGGLNMLPNTAYKVEVASYAGGVWSGYGSVCVVTTGASVPRYSQELAEEGLFDASSAAALSLNVYPNPAAVSQEFAVELNGIEKANETVLLDIYNVLGERVYRSQIITKEESRMVIKPEQVLAPGVYTVEARLNGNVKRVKFVVQ
jgi:Ig-like domain CHU_C associated